MTVNANDQWHPVHQDQGPACNCKIDGKCLGWLSCTAYAMAMLIQRETLGRLSPTGCQVRTATGDTSGGLTAPQVANAARAKWGINFEVRTGSNLANYRELYAALRKGRAALIQGYSGALIGTVHRSTGTGVNHAVLAYDAGDFDEDGLPGWVAVEDPAADGRRASWGTADQGPARWPRHIFEKFCAQLHPWGEADRRTLGTNRVYCIIGSDTHPHDHLRYGAKRTTPFPDRTRGYRPGKRVNIYPVPNHQTTDPIGTIAHGELFIAYQVTNAGSLFDGSRRWYGNHAGTKWIHSARLSHEGGTT